MKVGEPSIDAEDLKIVQNDKLPQTLHSYISTNVGFADSHFLSFACSIHSLICGFQLLLLVNNGGCNAAGIHRSKEFKRCIYLS